MSVSLDTAVESQLDKGYLRQVDLVTFYLPSNTVRYWRGNRSLTYDSQTYMPNRFLESESFADVLGSDVQSRKIAFSNVPTSNASDLIADLESYDYQNSTVVIASLAIDPDDGSILGLLVSHTYEINEVSYRTGALDKDGNRLVTIEIDLEPPGRSARDATNVKRTLAEQQFDNDATDTGLDHVATVGTWVVEWGQR